MTWEELVDGLSRSGHAPEELAFMENYGTVALGQQRVGEGRHLRCMFGTIRVDGDLRFDAYLFPSEAEAEEFLNLMRESGWRRLRNVVLRSEPAATPRLGALVEDLMK